MSSSNTSSPRVHPLRPKYSWRSRASHTSDATAEASISRDLEQVYRDESGLHAETDDEEDSGSDLESLRQTTSNPQLSMVGSYRQPSLAGAGSRAFLGTASLDPPRVPTKRERMQARKEERRLLKDNDDSQLSIPQATLSQTRSREPDAMLFPKSARSSDPERQPLLEPNREQSKNIDAEWEEAVLSGRIATTWQREAKFLVKSSPPLIATYLLQYSLTLASVFTVGHLGTVELGAASLASMTANIASILTGYAAYYGLTTALDTLNAQAYVSPLVLLSLVSTFPTSFMIGGPIRLLWGTMLPFSGSGKKALVGLQLQRMVLFLWAITVPIGFVWFFADVILLHIVPEEEVALQSGLYLKILIGGLPALVVFEASKRFLQAQGIFTASLYILLIAAPLNALMNYLFVWTFKLGFIGAPIAVVVTNNLMGTLMYGLVIRSECWPGWSKRALVNWGPMIKLALPGWIMVEAEVAAFEILTLASSYFGEKSLAAQSVLATLASVTFQIPFPVASVASTRIANLIGATLTKPAKVQARVLVCVEAIVGTLNVMVLLATRNVIAKLFTDDPEVIRVVASVIPVLVAFQVFDAQACSCNGLLRGLGKPAVGGYTQLICYYLVAMPISMGTAFGLDWQLHGLWTGVAIALSLVVLIEYTFIYRFDWERSVEDARFRNESG